MHFIIDKWDRIMRFIWIKKVINEWSNDILDELIGKCISHYDFSASPSIPSDVPVSGGG